MRKALGAALVAAALLLVSACSGSSSGGGSSKDATSTTGERSSAGSTKTTGADKATTTVVTDTKTVPDWSAAFCGNFKAWRDALANANSRAAADVIPGDNKSAKDAIVALFGDAATETDDLIATLQSGGAPDIDDGDRLVDDLVAKFQGFSDAASSAQADAKLLDANAATFEQDASVLTTRFQDEVTKVGDSFAEIDRAYPSAELSTALTAECGG